MHNHWNVLRNWLLCEQKILPILPRFYARFTCGLISNLHSRTIVGESDRRKKMAGPLDAVTAIHNAFRLDMDGIDAAALDSARGRTGFAPRIERFRQ